MGSIHDFLEKKGGTLQDLDETPENFKERIKETYKRKVNECKFNDEVHFKGY